MDRSKTEGGRSHFERKRGSLSALHMREGDVVLRFSPRKPADVARARQTITQLLAMGYTILVRDKQGRHRRIKSFRPATTTYLIADAGGEVEVSALRAHATAIPRSVGG